MSFTSHGHPVPGLPVEGKPEGPIARCGGPGLCVQCSTEAVSALRAAIAKHVEDPNEEQVKPLPGRIGLNHE